MNCWIRRAERIIHNSPWGMGNGEWGMGNGEWRNENEEWRIKKWEWGMENKEMRMKNGGWGMENKEMRMRNGELGMEMLNGNGVWENEMGNWKWEINLFLEILCLLRRIEICPNGDHRYTRFLSKSLRGKI